MTDPIASLVFSSAAGSVIVGAALLYLRRHDDNPSLLWWAAAIGLNAVRNLLVGLEGSGGTGIASILVDVCVAAEASLFLVGGLLFVGNQRFVLAIGFSFLALLLWIIGAAVYEASFLIRALPVYAAATGALLLTGWVFIRQGRTAPGFGYSVVGTVFALFGTLAFTYPFIRTSGVVAPWGFVAARSLGLAMAISLIIVSLLRQASRLDAANQRAAASATGLATTEERLRDFAEVSSDWLWEMGPDLSFTYVSDNIRQTVGSDPRVHLGQRLDEVFEIVPESQAGTGAIADLEKREPFRDLRCISRGPAGRVRHLLLNGKPIFDDHSRFLGYRGTGRDVTGSIEETERATQTQRRLVDAINGLSQGIALYDRDNRLVACNPAYIAVNELEPEILKPGVTFAAILRIRFERGLVKLAPGETIETFLQRRLDPQRRDAGPIEIQTTSGRWFQIHDQRLGDGGYAVSMADITATKQRERELAEKTQLLQSMMENLGEGISVFDANLRLVLWNDRMVEMTGQPRSMYKAGLPFEEVVRFSAEHGEYGPGDVEEQIRERIAMSTQPHPHRNARWRVNGRYVELRRNPMPGGGFVTIYSDLTDRQRVEDALRDAKEAAEGANRTKSEILANMSHELRTPLNAIIGFSDIILREAFGAIPQKRYLDYARDINESGTHLLALINDILDVSKAEAGRIEILDGMVDIVDMFQSCVRLVRPRADEAGIEIMVEPADSLPRLQGDSLRLKQVLINLLSNAVKFTPKGGRVTLRAEMNDLGGVSLSVQDTGVGMSPEDIPKALSPFGQLEQSLARRHAGTGLGLPLSKALVELHGGQLEIESEPGKGTTVTVKLPASRILAA